MKRLTLFLSIVVALVAAPFARAEGSLSDTALQAIRNKCVSAQIVLQNVQDADLLTRLNRGHRYDSLLKLMISFNGRVVQNKLDAPELITIVSDYQKNVEAFIDEYTKYNDALSTIIHMDCQNEPTTFNDRLVQLREKRTQLNAKVKTFDVLLENYKKGVQELKAKQGGQQ